MEGAVADSTLEEKARSDVLLFNRWSYDDVQVCNFDKLVGWSS